MPNDVKALIITGVGLNCEKETAAAFNAAGAKASLIHINDLLSGKATMEPFQILAFIGGFSFGDHLGSGTVFANKIKFKLKEELNNFIDSGKLIIGICNGFQTLTRLGLVPALEGGRFTQQAALAHNDSGVFRDAWITMKANPACKCVFTRGIDRIRMPIRHGEGKFAASPEMIDKIEKENLVALRYTDEAGNKPNGFPDNPNGSINDIAGICDPTGRVFGLMPHPEAFLSPYNAPDWQTQKLLGKLPDKGEGMILFTNAVDYVKASL